MEKLLIVKVAKSSHDKLCLLAVTSVVLFFSASDLYFSWYTTRKVNPSPYTQTREVVRTLVLLP